MQKRPITPGRTSISSHMAEPLQKMSGGGFRRLRLIMCVQLKPACA